MAGEVVVHQQLNKMEILLYCTTLKAIFIDRCIVIIIKYCVEYVNSIIIHMMVLSLLEYVPIVTIICA